MTITLKTVTTRQNDVRYHKGDGLRNRCITITALLAALPYTNATVLSANLTTKLFNRCGSFEILGDVIYKLEWLRKATKREMRECKRWPFDLALHAQHELCPKSAVPFDGLRRNTRHTTTVI